MGIGEKESRPDRFAVLAMTNYCAYNDKLLRSLMCLRWRVSFRAHSWNYVNLIEIAVIFAAAQRVNIVFLQFFLKNFKTNAEGSDNLLGAISKLRMCGFVVAAIAFELRRKTRKACHETGLDEALRSSSASNQSSVWQLMLSRDGKEVLQQACR